MKRTILSAILICFVFSCFPSAFADSGTLAAYSCYADGSGSGLRLKNLSCTQGNHSSCGGVEVVNYGGRKAYLIDDSAKTKALEFEFVSAFASGNTEFKNLEIEVEYADTYYGAFYIDYNSFESNNKTIKDYTEIYNTSYGKTAPEVKTAVYRIEDANFKNQGGYHGSDFKINVPQSDRGKGVYIYGVSVREIGTVSGISVASSSKSAGNIFFDGDEKNIDVSFSSLRADTAELEAVFTVLNESGKTVQTETQNITVSGGGTKTVSISAAAAHKYGTYTLTVEGTDAAKRIQIMKKIPFSVCVNAMASGGNNKMGIGAHFNWGREYEGGMSIIKKMGINNIRDGYAWDETEKEKGIYTEPQKLTSYLAAAKEKDFGLLLLAGYGNSLYGLDKYCLPKTDTQREAFACYVENMLKVHGESIKTVEIWNEPDITTFNKNGATPEDYAKLVKAVYDKIHTEFPEVEISGPVISQSLTESGQAWLERLLKCDTDGNNVYDMAEYLGAISVHHYPQGHYLTVSESVEKLKTLNKLLEKYGCGSKPRYHTEFGLVSLDNRYFSRYCSNDGVLVNRGDKKCAAQLSQYYLQLSVNDIADRFYIYELADNGLAENSGLLGLTKSVSGDVPNEAKPALIAMANINRLTGGFEGVSENVSGNVHKLLFKRDETGQELVALYTEEKDGSVEYTFNSEGKTAEFFDMYGNLFNPVSENGEYKLTLAEEPIYVRLSGESDGVFEAVYDAGAVRLSGKLFNVSAGEPLAVKVLDKEGNIVYLNQVTINENNSFSAVFKADMGESYVLNLGNRLFSGIYIVDINASDIKRCLVNVLSGKVKIETMEELRTAESAAVNVAVFDSGIEDFRLVVGCYKNGVLLNAKMFDKNSPDITSGETEGTFKVDMKAFETTNADCVKIYMFSGKNSITPLDRNIVLE